MHASWNTYAMGIQRGKGAADCNHNQGKNLSRSTGAQAAMRQSSCDTETCTLCVLKKHRRSIKDKKSRRVGTDPAIRILRTVS
jgi:hypothetical protein